MQARTGIKMAIPVLILTMLIFGYQNCGQYNFSQSPTNNNSTNNPLSQGQCFTDNFNEPNSTITNSVDILFVVHTTSSFTSVRQTVVAGLSNFVNQLPAGADYQVAVMPAHSPQSTKTSGTLMVPASNPNKIPPVLSSKTMTASQIVTDLDAIMTDPQTAAEGSDEEGLASLYTGLDATHFAAAQAQGFFRPNAALAIVFLANESDMCGETAPAIGNYNPQNTDTDWSSEYKASTLPDCFNAGQTMQIITPVSVYQRVQQMMLTNMPLGQSKPNPFVIGGVVYTNPAQKALSNGDEAEYGWGYMDLINLATGIGVDINSNIATGLASIGQMTVTQLNLQTNFTPSQTDIDPSTITVLVDGSVDTNFTYQSSINDVNVPNPGTPGGPVQISYCQLSSQ